LWDACIAISNYLVDAAKKVNPGLPVIKVTPLGDFDLFDANDKKTDVVGEYVMFCGHAGYFDVVKFIIDSYKASAISNSKQLLLVLGGRQDQITRVKEYYDKCIIKSRIPYDELVALYKHAFALMIPLRNTIEDTARFPNKICEYTAAHGLIVTTNNGEMQYYFKNSDNAVVADECSVDSISSRLDEIEAGKYDLQKIRERSYQTGIDNFSIDTYKESLYNFLKTI
jgi:glycosyltransferase involved in cell wall biosynthesis